MSDVSARPALDAAAVAAVRALAEAATSADAQEPFSEQFLRNLGQERDDLAHLVAGDGAPVGYAQLAGDSAELAVHPDARGRGIGTALLRALLERDPKAGVWAHGNLPAAARLAARAGLHPIRELWQMRRTPDAGALPALTPPEGVRIRPFVVGVDEPELLRVNNAAFDWHPEQGGWTLAEVREREGEPWFDPDGFLVAEPAPAAADAPLLGFHWTKTHPATATEPAMGEVYVLGVDPAAHGRGLGLVLTLAGLHHLHARGLDTVRLFVEADNAAAVRLYERLGFTVHARDVVYATWPPDR